MRRLVLLAAVLSSAVALQVQIQLRSSLLRLTLPVIGRDNGGVVFHYVIKNVAYQGVGERIQNGWQYLTHDVLVDGAEDIKAYAEIHDVKGHLRFRTERSSLKLMQDGSVLAARLPSRKMRAAVLFRDDFNTLDLSSWHQEVSMYGGMNWEFQVYTNDAQNTFTNNGYLYLQPTLTVNYPGFDENFLHSGIMDMENLFGICTQSANYGCTRNGMYGLLPPVMSGKLMSNVGMRYGTVEVRARIPRGDWLWPAIWMLPKSNVYGGWPRSGEIDLMESRGNLGNIGIGSVSSTLHWGPSYAENRYFMTTGDKQTGSWADEFHTWKLVRTPDHLATYVDEELIMYVDPGNGGFWDKGGFSGSNIWANGEKMAPFDEEFYMIFNVAVGGTNGYFPDNGEYGVTKPWTNGGGDAAKDFWDARSQWESTWDGDKAALVIDYIEIRDCY